ncbi:restriction endonuclease fold toxin 5 of polymorphic toxin system [Providencia alcalifaciens]|uniref:Restriction endonuclease fold toxin 5 of polymorphic toxin system n=1 Tax=Providencia alcalifaciens TaxID=126385 RepID=A0A4R3NQI3_9GAMM|nr:Tox-REase-5 domain-containing protein [Providencia alcalifaciens]TCT34436.1 restriction endonuclease fold toxin 5 of polymorphic toxin system [Providencia alcalifaciens]
MPVPLIIAGAGLMTLGGLAAVTHEASKIGFPSSSGSGDDEWGNTSYEDKIREYESIAIGGEFDDEEKKRGNNQGAAVGATAGASVGVAAIEASKGCQDCPAIPYIVPHQNDITNTRTPNAYAYQARICNTQIRTVDTPAGQMRYIDEWKCTIPVPTRTLNPLVEFDGWKPDECNFIETKDNFDFAFDKDGNVKSFFSKGGKPLKQASEQNWLCEFPLKKKSYSDWHFSQKNMYLFCTRIFQSLPQIRTHHTT